MALGAVGEPGMGRADAGPGDEAMTTGAILPHPRGMGNGRWRSGPSACTRPGSLRAFKVILAEKMLDERWFRAVLFDMTLRAIGVMRMADLRRHSITDLDALFMARQAVGDLWLIDGMRNHWRS